MTSSIKELAGPVPETTPEEAELCARMIARHATSPDDAAMLAEALGLSAGLGEAA